MDRHTSAADQFGASAANYLSSAVHATGADLDRLVKTAIQTRPRHVLDLGSGAGHVSFALARGGAQRITAYDLSTQMLDVVRAEAAVRGHAHIETVSGPAEALPFANATFDLIVSRYSAHHWLDLPAALNEAARVLTGNGSLIIIDVVAPEIPLMDTVLQTLELLRDWSHVRDYRESEWRAMLQSAGFEAPAVDCWKLRLEFQGWIARIATPDARVAALKVVFDALPHEAREYFAVAGDYSFSTDSGWFEAEKA